MEFTALQQNVVEVSTWHSAIIVLDGIELTAECGGGAQDFICLILFLSFCFKYWIFVLRFFVAIVREREGKKCCQL